MNVIKIVTPIGLALLLAGCGSSHPSSQRSTPTSRPLSAASHAATRTVTPKIVAWDPVNIIRRASGCTTDATRGELPYGGGPSLYATCQYPPGDMLQVWGYPSHAVMVADLKIDPPSHDPGKTIMLGDSFLAELSSSPYGPAPATVAAQIKAAIQP